MDRSEALKLLLKCVKDALPWPEYEEADFQRKLQCSKQEFMDAMEACEELIEAFT